MYTERKGAKRYFAKLTGPLMSIDARGKLADAMVFMGWKGIKTVRQWVKPANPNTAGQQTIRGYFTSAVDKFHLLLGADKVAWDNRTAGQPLSGFNLFVRKVINVLKVATGAWINLTAISAAAATDVITATSDTAVATGLAKVKWGLTSGTYPNETVSTAPMVAATPYAFPALTGVVNGQTVYYTVEATNANPLIKGESGEYSYIAT